MPLEVITNDAVSLTDADLDGLIDALDSDEGARQGRPTRAAGGGTAGEGKAPLDSGLAGAFGLLLGFAIGRRKR